MKPSIGLIFGTEKPFGGNVGRFYFNDFMIDHGKEFENQGIKKPARGRYVLLELTLNFGFFVTLYDITNLNVVEVIYVQSAFISGSYFLHVILEAFE